MKINCEINL